jgi:N-acetylglutamate synthase-like GNAT family acetyltransferase
MDAVPSFQVRQATAADAAAIAGLLDGLGYPSTAGQVMGRLAGLAADSASHVLVAEASSEVVAVAAFHVRPALTRDEPFCRIIALSVAPAWSRRGVATALVDALEAVARAAGCSQLEVTTADDRAGARALYEQLGFKRTSSRLMKTLAP